MRGIALIAAALAVAVPAPLAAQSDAPALFVNGVFFGGVERFSHLEGASPTRSNEDVSGTTTGPAFAVGSFIAPRWSVRLDVELPSTLRTVNEPTPVVPPPLPVPRSRTEIEYRARSASVLLGFHTNRRHRLRMGYLVGVAFVEERRRRVDRTIFFPGPPPPFPILPSDTTIVTNRAAGTIGADGDILLVRQLSLVGQARVRWFLGGLTARAGVGVRWNF